MDRVLFRLILFQVSVPAVPEHPAVPGGELWGT